jgi:dTDP-4-amino-4,6-dideoxygalactose transaminase
VSIALDDLALQFREVEEEALEAAARVLRSGRYILTQGTEVKAFEDAFGAYCECAFTVGTSSGTSALQLALTGAGVLPGDEVLVPANTYIATAFAATHAGARPVLVDCDPETYTIDVEAAAARITPRTRAIMPVHLYGQPADMDDLLRLAAEHDLAVVEDCAQAHGARYGGRRVGGLGTAGAFSFYPTKNLGAVGDAGAMTTDDEQVAARVRQLRYMGQKVKYDHEIVGYQDRLDELQAAVLAVKLARLDAWNGQRRAQAGWYDELLADTPVERPVARAGREHVYHLYVIRAPRRDELRDHLADRGIATGIFYPIPVPLQGAYAELGHRPGDFPETERAAAETLALPLFPGYDRSVIETVAAAVTAFYGRGSRRAPDAGAPAASA